ncbi:MAG: ABC transporter ATP-binding protein [Tepidisphaeraceae bacterium]
MRPIIEVSNLSKAYRIGQQHVRHASFWESALGIVKSPLKQLRRLRENFDDNAPDIFWALKDVSFQVEQGEVIGLIGRNGAGKSTLLKILSRIVEPTAGRAVMRGRTAALLEVGTGFHPELTGRENIFLNGAILGMSKAEITRKFDDIVEFSEIGNFLDTPVKRYSSGMYVRLAFSVAAHLDPQIMIVDEVLAVGDASFQRKCLGKMNDCVNEGRTIIFVSHSMDAIASLCKKTIIMKGGRASEKQDVRDGVTTYLQQVLDAPDKPLHEKPRTQHEVRPPIFHDLKITTRGEETMVVPTGGPIEFEIQLRDFDKDPGALTCGLALTNQYNQRVAFFHTLYHSDYTFTGAKTKTLRCEIPALPLTPGQYFVELVIADGFKIIERVERAATVEVLFADLLGTGKLPMHHQSPVVLPAKWSDAG